MTTNLVQHLTAVLLLLPVGNFANRATSAEPEEDDQPPVIRLAIDPVAEPVPALKYQLPPDYLEEVPGDAAQFYYRAALMMESMAANTERELADNYEKWFDESIDEKTSQEITNWVLKHENVIAEIQKAFLRTHCNWDLGVRELKGDELVRLLLPEIQRTRSMARMLSLKARIEIDGGRYDDAFGTLRLGYRLAQDASQQPTLISALVAVAIVGIMNDAMEQLIAAPNSPNMYWAIASVPRPVVDMQRAMRSETAFAVQMFPFLKDAEQAEASVEYWRNHWKMATKSMAELGDNNFAFRRSGWPLDVGVLAWMLRGYPMAKRDLIDAGYDAREVESMPVGQVVAIHQRRVYQIAYHEMTKWSLLPYAESHDFVGTVNDKLGRAGYLAHGPGRSKEVLPFVSLLTPAITAAFEAAIRPQRQLALLRTIEAIRMYAAAHDGRLPPSLESIKQVPVPHDPLDGKPFQYDLEGNEATLHLPAPPGKPARHFGKRYKLSIRK